jgi:putative Ca2+/H+ antiporter (TMEM165/GDT1 family)
MGYYLLKLIITSVLIVAISEIGKKSSLVGVVEALVSTSISASRSP